MPIFTQVIAIAKETTVTQNPVLARWVISHLRGKQCRFKKVGLHRLGGLLFGTLVMAMTSEMAASQTISQPSSQHRSSSPATLPFKTDPSPAALESLDQLITHHQNQREWSQVGRLLTEKAQVLNQLNQPKQAIALLCNPADRPESSSLFLGCNPQSAVAIAQRYNDPLGQAAALGSLGTVYVDQGRYETGLEFLQASLAIAREQKAKPLVNAALNNLGTAYSGLASRSYRYTQLAQQDQDPESAVRLQQQAQAYDQEALSVLQAALSQTQHPRQQLQTRLNRLLPQARQGRDLQPELQQLESQLSQQPHSPETVYGLITLAKWYAQPNAMQEKRVGRCHASDLEQVPSDAWAGAIAQLQTAAAMGQQLNDRNLVALAQGELGHLYECRGDYRNALALTQQAQLGSELSDTSYLWDWQAGRIFEQLGQTESATTAYDEAIQRLEALRGDLTAGDRNLQLDFRDTVAQLYRQLAALQFTQAGFPTQALSGPQGVQEQDSGGLKSAPKSVEKSGNLRSRSSSPRNTQLLKRSLATLEQLHLSELQDYLGELCDFSAFDLSQPPAIAAGSAVINTMILPDQLVVVASFPDGQVKTHQVSVDSATLAEDITSFRRLLEQRSDLAHRYRPQAEQLYDWLIRPFEAELAAQNTETFIFIQDGILRSIPMATLHDGQQFLMERYGIAYTPSLALLNARDPAPSASSNPLDQSQVIAFGLTESAQVSPRLSSPSAEALLSQLRPTASRQSFFASLPAVRQELEGIQAIAPQAQIFFNQDFTRGRLQDALSDASSDRTILHLATHARFSFDARETFLVTGETDPVTMNDLYRMIQRASQSRASTNLLDLMMLTGCETAAGSDRDALGIAGVALQAGARSAVASLWQVDDAATAEMVVSFYDHLFEGKTKAQALQLSQQQWLQGNPTGLYSHPGYWAALVLVGQSG